MNESLQKLEVESPIVYSLFNLTEGPKSLSQTLGTLLFFPDSNLSYVSDGLTQINGIKAEAKDIDGYVTGANSTLTTIQENVNASAYPGLITTSLNDMGISNISVDIYGSLPAYAVEILKLLA